MEKIETALPNGFCTDIPPDSVDEDHRLGDFTPIDSGDAWDYRDNESQTYVVKRGGSTETGSGWTSFNVAHVREAAGCKIFAVSRTDSLQVTTSSFSIPERPYSTSPIVRDTVRTAWEYGVKRGSKLLRCDFSLDGSLRMESFSYRTPFLSGDSAGFMTHGTLDYQEFSFGRYLTCSIDGFHFIEGRFQARYVKGIGLLLSKDSVGDGMGRSRDETLDLFRFNGKVINDSLDKLHDPR